MSVRIGVGVAGFPFSGKDAFWRWIDLAEDSEIDSLWLNERLVSTQPLMEPIAALAAVAGRTRRIKFGMNAVVLPLRDPLILAKECATIDYLSGGRLLPVFGVGNDVAPEWKATGRSPDGRGTRANETLQLLARLWTQEHVTFHGKYFQYDDVTIAPRPVQRELPLWIGGNSDAAIDRVARYGTGWLGGGGLTPALAGEIVAKIKARLEKTGRSVEEDHYGLGIPFRFGSWDEPVVQRAGDALANRLPAGTPPSAAMAVGDARQIVERVQQYVDAGLAKFVLRPIASSDDEILEQTRRLAEEVIPVVHRGVALAV